MSMSFLLQGARGKPGLPGMPGSDGLPVSGPGLYSPQYAACKLRLCKWLSVQCVPFAGRSLRVAIRSLMGAAVVLALLADRAIWVGRAQRLLGSRHGPAVTFSASFLQGHPGKEGPPGTKGNQVRPSLHTSFSCLRCLQTGEHVLRVLGISCLILHLALSII